MITRSVIRSVVRPVVRSVVGLAGGGLVSPADLGALTAWAYDDSPALTAAGQPAGDGEAIATLPDLTGNGLPFAQSDVAKRPTADAQGVAVFDGVDDQVGTPIVSRLRSEGAELWGLVSFASTSLGVFAGWGVNSSLWMMFRLVTPTSLRIFYGSVFSDLPVASFLGSWRVVRVRSLGDVCEVSVDGVVIAELVTETGVESVGTYPVIWGNLGAGGKIAALSAFRGNLSDADAAAMFAAYDAKRGVLS